MNTRKVIAALLALGSLATTAAACRGVLGIDDREYDPALDTTRAPTCDEYCGTVMAACTNDNKSSVYASLDVCQQICQRLTPGTVADEAGDTVGCREGQASAAKNSGELESCSAAGPGGNGRCGTNCEAYCILLKGICPTQFNAMDDCAAECAAVPDKGHFTEPVDDENSLQCRLFHLSSATQDPVEHCPHAAGLARCVDQADAGGDGG